MPSVKKMTVNHMFTVCQYAEMQLSYEPIQEAAAIILKPTSNKPAWLESITGEAIFNTLFPHSSDLPNATLPYYQCFLKTCEIAIKLGLIKDISCRYAELTDKNSLVALANKIKECIDEIVISEYFYKNDTDVQLYILRLLVNLLETDLIKNNFDLKSYIIDQTKLIANMTALTINTECKPNNIQQHISELIRFFESNLEIFKSNDWQEKLILGIKLYFERNKNLLARRQIFEALLGICEKFKSKISLTDIDWLKYYASNLMQKSPDQTTNETIPYFIHLKSAYEYLINPGLMFAGGSLILASVVFGYANIFNIINDNYIKLATEAQVLETKFQNGELSAFETQVYPVAMAMFKQQLGNRALTDFLDKKQTLELALHYIPYGGLAAMTAAPALATVVGFFSSLYKSRSATTAHVVVLPKWLREHELQLNASTDPQLAIS